VKTPVANPTQPLQPKTVNPPAPPKPPAVPKPKPKAETEVHPVTGLIERASEGINKTSEYTERYAPSSKVAGGDMANSKDVSNPRLRSIHDEEEAETDTGRGEAIAGSKNDTDPPGGLEGAFLIPEDNKQKKIGDADDPDQFTGDIQSMYSRGNRRKSALSSSSSAGKKPSFLSTRDEASTLRNMNAMNRDFWGNGRNRGRRGR
jgi:hypothetical protein